MKSCGKNGLLRPWLAGVFVTIVAVLAGCADVQVVQPTMVSQPELFDSPLPAGEGQHNLAVMAVEFDPPLSYQQLIARRQTVALLVVVENRGTATERAARVRAQLTSPEDPSFLLSQEAQVASIAAGEIQIVRFARLKEIPYHRAYHLEVTVDPVAGETELGDNGQAFDVHVRRE